MNDFPRNDLPTGWDEARVKALIDDYDNLTDAALAADIEASSNDPKCTFVQVPVDLAPLVVSLVEDGVGPGQVSLAEIECLRTRLEDVKRRIQAGDAITRADLWAMIVDQSESGVLELAGT